MIDIPVRIEFPRRPDHLDTVIRLHDATYSEIFRRLARERGWISVEEAADIAQLSKWQFSRNFNEMYGAPFRNVKSAFRLELSAIAVARTLWPLSEIAMEFHYSHIKKWDPAFKRYFRFTPSQYRTGYLRDPIEFDPALRFVRLATWRERSAA